MIKMVITNPPTPYPIYVRRATASAAIRPKITTGELGTTLIKPKMAMSRTKIAMMEPIEKAYVPTVPSCMSCLH